MCLLKLVGVHILTLAPFLALDAVWLGLMARDMYRRELGQLLAPGVQWGASGTFYVLYIVGLQVLVVLWNRHRAQAMEATLWAAAQWTAFRFPSAKPCL